MPRSIGLTGLLVGLCFSVTVSAQADPVTYWHNIATNAVNTGRPGPPGLLDMAVVQTAVHDAVQVIEGRFQPYHYSDPSKLGRGTTTAAVAAATRRALVLLYGAQPIVEAEYAAYVAANVEPGDEGLAIGEAAAQALYDDHYRPATILQPFTGNSEPGQWRSAVPMAFLYLASSTPFGLNRVDQFRPPPPPPLASMRYVRDYDEVKKVGEFSAHPNVNTDAARFWSGNFPFQWNEAARQVADNNPSLTLGDRARLLALANLAASDALMAVWDSKLFYNFWRPSTAIHFGDDDGNARTEGKAGWQNLFGTMPPNPTNPPYPDYVSGANGLTGAFTGLLREFFRTDTMSFSVKNPTTPLVIDRERSYTSFSQAAEEVVEARILLGIHFRFADEEARRLGERVAHWTIQQLLRPVPGSQN
jgi:hypothetical protein